MVLGSWERLFEAGQWAEVAQDGRWVQEVVQRAQGEKMRKS